MAMTADVLASPVLELLMSLEIRGCDVTLDGPEICIRPAGVLTAAERATLQAHYEDARMLVLLSTDAAIHARRDVFRQQLEAAPATMVSAFLFRPDVPYVKGRCFSCGDALDAVRFGRCWRCSLAWRLACRLSIPTSEYDEARVV
jgi:hypothetical protein